MPTRDVPLPPIADLRNVAEGDPSPDGKGEIRLARGVEVGHIFQLGTKYSEAMGATVQDQDGKDRVMEMGCYGIGVSRVVAAAIEQNHDPNGIIFPISIAPFEVVILPLQMHETAVIEAAEKIYGQLSDAGLDVLLDEGSVVGAARRMNLSPAAMSRTLTRIRDALGDDRMIEPGTECQHRVDQGAVVYVERDPVEKRLVDLDHIHRQAREIRQRRKAHNEVVQGDTHADCLEFGEQRLGALGIGQQHAFGHLEIEHRRRQAAQFAQRTDLVDELILTQLVVGDIDMHGHPGLDTGLPGGRGVERLVQYPTADLGDQPAVLGDRDELRR